MGSGVFGAVTLLCAFSVFSVRAGYDEKFAKQMLNLAAGAHANETQLDKCLATMSKKFEFLNFVEVSCDQDNNTCLAYFAVLHDLKAVVMAFRGTSTNDQMNLELLTLVETPRTFGSTNTTVNRYFGNAFDALWPSLKSNLTTLAKKYPKYELWVTGHSLGAALASMASLSAVTSGKWKAANMKVYFFGKPRVGYLDYRTLYSENVPESYRVVHHHDVIANLPPLFYGYLHESQWIWYDNNMTASAPYIACTGELDNRCLTSMTVDDNVMQDHNYYFGAEVTQYGQAGCVRTSADSWF